MAIKQDEYNRTCVLTAEADLIGDDVALLRQLAENAFSTQGLADVVIDLEKAGFIDSDGLEALLEVNRRCEEHQGQLKLASVDVNVRKILEITRLAHKFEIHADVTAALRTMR